MSKRPLPTVWCLQSPEGELILQTLAVHKRNAQGAAFDYLYYIKFPEGWPKDFWKKWDSFIRARRNRGWHVVQVTVIARIGANKA
jgi:hypothetical protein